MRSQMIRKRALEQDPNREWPTDQKLEETDIPGFKSVAPQKPAVGKDASEGKTADMMSDVVRKAVEWLRQHRKDTNVLQEAKNQMPLGTRIPAQVIEDFVRTGDESALIEKITPAAKPWEGRKSVASSKSRLFTEDDDNFEEPKRPEPEKPADTAKKDTGRSRSVKLDQHESPKSTPSAWEVDNKREVWHTANKKATPSAWTIDNKRQMPDEEKEMTTEEQINLKKKEGSRKNAMLSSLTTAFAQAWKDAAPEEKKEMARDFGKSYEEMDTFAHEWLQGSVAPEEAGDYLGVSTADPVGQIYASKQAAGGAEEEELQVDEPETGVDGTVVQLLEACKHEWSSLGDPVNPETWPKEIERAILSLNDDLVAAIQKTEDKLVEGEFYSKNVDEGVEGHGGSMLGDLNLAQPEMSEDSNNLPLEDDNEMVDMDEEVEKFGSKKAASLPDVSSTETRKGLKHVQTLKDRIAAEFFEFKKNVQSANDSSIVKNIGESMVALKVKLEDVEKMLAKQLQVLEDAEKAIDEKKKSNEKKGAAKTTNCVDCDQTGKVEDMAVNNEGAGYVCNKCFHKRRKEDDKAKNSALKTAACPTCGAQVLQNGKDSQGVPCPNCAKKSAPNPEVSGKPLAQPSGALPPPQAKPQSNVPQTGPVKHYGSKKLSLSSLALAGEE